MDLAIVSKLPVDDILNGSSSVYIDSILIRESDRNKIGVPLTHHKRKDSKIEGGYVHTINPGLYHWVCVLDFKSMYPSIIISKNICFTTLNKEGEIESPIGARFLTTDVRRGILPKILEDLMKAREDALSKMKKAENKDQRRYYDGLQAAIKVLMNSVYGVFASAFYRFTEPRIGASITAFARESIKNVITKLEDEGITVIYSDTDSVFIQSPHEDLEVTKKFGDEISKKFSKDVTRLEFEKVMEPLFSHGKKKRYVGKVVWPEEDIIVRGYETRRTDAFDLQSEALYKTFEKILGDDIEGAVKTARETVTDILEGKAPIEKLVISRTCRPESAYKNPDSMVNVLIARKLVDMGYDFVPGMKVSWIVTNSKQTPQGAEPYIDGRDFEFAPDWDYYANRVAMTLARVTDVFGWDEKSLLVGAQQTNLFSDSFKDDGSVKIEDKTEKKPGKAKAKGPKKTDKKLTLEDFI
jgi:DNA polymerase I